MELDLAVDSATLIERPLIGLAPWVDAPASKERWDKFKVFLEYLNFPAYHFHATHAVYRREIDTVPLNSDGLAGHFDKSYAVGADGELSGGSELEGLIRAMQFAHKKNASLHMITARPGQPYPTTVNGDGVTPNAFAKDFGDYMEPFSIRGYISYMAEFIRYAQQHYQLPIQIVNLIDEPRWVFLHAANPPDDDNPHGGAYYGQKNRKGELYTKEYMWSLYPATWDFAYTFLDQQLKERGARRGINIQMLSDVYPSAHDFPSGVNDVVHLLTSPAITAASNGLCFVNYSGPDGADMIIRQATEAMATPGAAHPRIFFKDMGGGRIPSNKATEEDEFAFGIDSIVGAIRAFRQGVDFCAQYFFVLPESKEPVPHDRMFAAFWNGSDYAARIPLAPLALFSKTQTHGAYRMKDPAGAAVPGVDYLTLLSNRGTATEYYTHYFVNRSKETHTVNLRPVRQRKLYRYWLNRGYDSGRTIQAQTLAPAATVKVPLPPRSVTAITEQEVTNLNWPIKG